ncbi:hypothetical protein BDN72DRAFT_906771 [Pluteus cervinus]|uniref:Uncharacterized protein n=1 Tax=Pluteus cervinus TaxID=181527 RepID=A0ACD2ZY89_9AGAR|nr:hypothetical protein BDN72DRAFT_906771 [Pluteus cervinus]
MEPHPFDPHFHLRSKLEEEILELESRLQTLRLKRNALLPISSLPEEVLVEIFLLANTSNKSGLVVSGWIVKMGWVCHTWRKLALDHPLLWTEITEELCERWTREFLKRSGSAVIYLEICHDEEQEDLLATKPGRGSSYSNNTSSNPPIPGSVGVPIATKPFFGSVSFTSNPEVVEMRRIQPR